MEPILFKALALRLRLQSDSQAPDLFFFLPCGGEGSENKAGPLMNGNVIQACQRHISGPTSHGVARSGRPAPQGQYFRSTAGGPPISLISFYMYTTGHSLPRFPPPPPPPPPPTTPTTLPLSYVSPHFQIARPDLLEWTSHFLSALHPPLNTYIYIYIYTHTQTYTSTPRGFKMSRGVLEKLACGGRGQPTQTSKPLSCSGHCAGVVDMEPCRAVQFLGQRVWSQARQHALQAETSYSTPSLRPVSASQRATTTTIKRCWEQPTLDVLRPVSRQGVTDIRPEGKWTVITSIQILIQSF